MSEPLVSIGIVTYNSAWCLLKVLDGVLGLDYPKKQTRLVFVDNLSTDNSLTILKSFKEQHTSEFEEILLIERGRHDAEDIAEGRTLCIDNADGEYYLSLDSDALMRPETLRRMLTHFHDHSDIGEVQFLAKEPIYRSRVLNMLNNAYVSKEPTQPYYGWTGGMHCVGIRMDLAKSLKFRTGFGRGTDEDFHFRLQKQGYKILIDPACRAEHVKPTDTESGAVVFLHYLEYLFWRLPRFHVPMLFSHTSPPRQLLRLALYWALLLGLILLPFYPWLFLLSLLVSIVYEFVKSTGIYRIINPILYPLFGLVYGLGMLREIVARAVKPTRS